MKDLELEKALNNFDGTKITIRPSSIDGYTNCARQWAMVFIGGRRSIPGARAAIGTAIHAGVEHAWTTSIKAKAKEFDIPSMEDASIREFAEMGQEGLQYDNNENLSTSVKTIREGIAAFVEDVVPWTNIPEAVEKRYTVDLVNPVIKNLSGTVDYISSDTIADVKTSRRKPVPASYTSQQSVYKYLANANGLNIKHSLIQGVVLNKNPYGTILAMETNIPAAKYLVNSILGVAKEFSVQSIHPMFLFRGNPKYYLCSEKYCSFHATCPYVKGELKSTP